MSTFRKVVRAARLQKEADDWNAAHRVGAEVVVLTDTKGPIFTRTRSEAQVLSGHSVVVWLEGISGCYALERVKPRASLSETDRGAA